MLLSVSYNGVEDLGVRSTASSHQASEVGLINGRSARHDDVMQQDPRLCLDTRKERLVKQFVVDRLQRNGNTVVLQGGRVFTEDASNTI